MTHRILAARLRRCLAFALALLMAAVLAMQATRPALADDKQKELENKKNQIQQELDALKQEQTQNQETIDSAEAQRETAAKQKDLLQQQMAVIQQKIDDLNAQIAEKEQEITDKQAEVDAKQAEFDGQLDAFKERLTAMQRLNTSGAIDLLSNASNMFQLLTFNRVLDSIAAQDQEICTELDTQKKQLETEKAQLETEKAELETQEAAQVANHNDLNNTATQLAGTIQQLDSTISDAEAMDQALASAISDKLEEFNRAADELDSYLRSLISDAQNNYASAPISCSLNFICPLDTYKYISCQYGAGGHKGVDFAAPGNTPIRAIASGQVITATSHYSYGNYVMVYHGTDDQGNTYATLYAHMIQWPSVSVGQAVSQGDILGYVGSTGNSTGNHLHLELRVNGARTNPLNYVPH